MKKPNYKEQLKKYIEEKWKIIADSCPIIEMYSIDFDSSYQNEDNGNMSISYTPTMFECNLYIHRIIYDEIPEKGLTLRFKNGVLRSLCHELAHCYLWEHEATDNVNEKTCTLIGMIIFNLLKERNQIE